MKHASNEESCPVCKANSGESPSPGGVVWENDLWFLRHAPPPYALAGWMMLHTQRHVQGPAHFTDEEASAFGPVLKHISRTLEVVTGTPRVYLVAFGESTPHMHAHLIPRYENLPAEQVAFGIADLNRSVANGTLPGVPESEALSVAAKLRDALKASPPPS